MTILKYPKTATLNQDQILQHVWVSTRECDHKGPRNCFFCTSGSVLGFKHADNNKTHWRMSWELLAWENWSKKRQFNHRSSSQSRNLLEKHVLSNGYWQLGHDDRYYSPRRMDSSLQGLLLKTRDIRPILQCHPQIGPSSKSRCLLRRL